MEPYTRKELNTWKANPTVNPRTRRRITRQGRVYQKLRKSYYKLYENEIYALHNAAENGNFKRVQELLATGIDPTSENNSGWTSLHAAARGGNLKIITELLTNGVSVNQEDDSGVTPLHIAIEKSKVGATYALLDAGANCSFEQRFSFLLIAVSNECLPLVNLLLKDGAD